MIYISNTELSYHKRDVITDPQCTVWGLDQQNQQERWRENWGGAGGGGRVEYMERKGREGGKESFKELGIDSDCGFVGLL